MTRIRFEDLPSTNTPRNAENLNKLNNIVISSTEPTTGEEVWLQKGKNLFDKNNANVINAYIGGNSVITYEINNKTLYIPCTPNTTYTIYKMVAQPQSANRFRVGTTSTIPQIGDTVSDFYNAGGDGGNVTEYTITTSSTAKYLLVTFINRANATTTVEEMLASVQIEESSSATTYEAYKQKKIYIANDNGNYELFTETVSKNEELVVGSIRSKNMFNINNNPSWIGANTTYSVSNNELTVSGNYFVGFLINVKQNTDYFISAIRIITTSTTNTGSIRIFKADQTTPITSHNTGNFTFNSGSNSQIYITFYSGTGNNGVVKFSNIQLEQGSEASNYMPYQNLNGYNNYSTEETRIGTWIDGKPLYRKVFTGAMPQVQTDGTFVATNININSLNIDVAFFDNPFFMGYPSGTKSIQPLPSLNQNNMSQGALISVWSTAIEIRSNRTVWNTFTYYVPLIYTKTTD